MDLLRPLLGAAVQGCLQRMAIGGGDLTMECAFLSSRRVEILDAAAAVREDDARSEAIVTVIDNRLVRRDGCCGRRKHLARGQQSVEKTVPHVGETEEAVSPHGVIAQRLRIETCREFALVA